MKGRPPVKCCKRCGGTEFKRYGTRQNRECVACRSKRVKDATLRRNYGISLEQYDDLLKVQGGRCAICRVDMEEYPRRFSVDHCHISSRVRGLLCLQCNVGLGNLRESPSLMMRALEYLLSHGGEADEGN